MSLSTVDLFKHFSDGDGLIEVKGQKLQTLQSILLMMLSDINEVCDKNGIEYVLGGGTCLGAIRHGGFIPWDDDIDINMTRDSFDRLATLLEAQYSDKYAIQRVGKGCELAFPRIRLKNTTLRSREDFGGGDCGVYIDVFMIDNAPNSVVLRKLHGFISMALGFAWSCRRFAEHADELIALAGSNANALSVFKKKVRFGRLFSFLSLESWVRAWDSWNAIVKDNDSEYVVIPAGRKHYFGEIYPRSQYFPPERATFCGLSAPIPADVDAYMKALYGMDYMIPPAEADRETHVVFELDFGKYADICGGVANSDDE